MAMAGKYDWGRGGKVHSISKATHQQNVAAKQALGGSLDLTAPPTGVQAVTEANSAADLQYGPQVNAAKQLQANVNPWYTDYMARVAGYAQAARTQMAPVLAQATAYQEGAATQAPPGLDPTSAAGQQAAQAAAGRGALAQLGNDALNTNAQATQDYFGGQQAMAAKQLPDAQAQATTRLADAQSQRGAKVQEFLTGARQNAQNYQIARGTLNLNDAKAQADAADAAAVVTEKNRHNVASETNTANKTAAQQTAAANKQAAAGATPNKYGIPADQWNHWSTRHRQRTIDAFNAKGAQGANDKAAAKHASDVHAATGKVENTVTDIINTWDTFAKTGQVDDTTKPLPDAAGKAPNTPGWKPTYKQRPPHPSEIKSQLAADHPTWSPQMIHIALLRSANPPKPLDQASIDYLHNLGTDVRIPKGWLAATRGYGDKGGGT